MNIYIYIYTYIYIYIYIYKNILTLALLKINTLAGYKKIYLEGVKIGVVKNN